MVEKITPFNSTENRVLAVLPEKERASLFAHFEPAMLSFRQVLCRQGEEAEYAYFPLGSVTSIVWSDNGGRSIEVGMVGCEGLTAAQSIFGVNQKSYETVVQVAGKALKVKLSNIKEQIQQLEATSNLLMLYINAFYARVAQVAACYHLNKLEQRLQTWLTMMFNRIKSDELLLT